MSDENRGQPFADSLALGRCLDAVDVDGVLVRMGERFFSNRGDYVTLGTEMIESSRIVRKLNSGHVDEAKAELSGWVDSRLRNMELMEEVEHARTNENPLNRGFHIVTGSLYEGPIASYLLHENWKYTRLYSAAEIRSDNKPAPSPGEANKHE